MTIDKRKLRDAMGSFATGVCVVTTADGVAPLGMTINSFSSVSLEPPLVLWSIQYTSDCFDAFNNAQKFAINILSEEQQQHSAIYSRRSEHQLDAAHYSLGRTGAPVLRDSLATFECRTWARYPGGDHLILVGEVLALTTRPSGRALLFHRGQYAQIR